MDDTILITLDGIVRDITSNPYFGLIGFIVGIIGLFFTIYVARRDKREKYLIYSTVTNNIIVNRSQFFPKLKITYDDKSLDNLTSTNLRIKNIGTEVIRLSDIAPNDPIQIMMKDDTYQLLDYGIIYQSDPNNNFKVREVGNRILQLEFDYVECSDAVTIQLIHTGRADDDLVIKGTIIGQKKPFSGDFTVSRLISPMGRILNTVYGAPSRVVAISGLLPLILLFGYLSYLTSSNLFISSLCIIPTTVFSLFFLRIVFRKSDPEREKLSKDILRAIMKRAVDFVDPYHDLRSKDIDDI